MRRKIPSILALSAFESAARHQSFTKAADELAVTQSAICRQIAILEDYLGIKLFHRSNRGVTLSPSGLSYSRKVTARLDDIERDTIELMSGHTHGGTLNLAVVPTFATKWLLPRLSKFKNQHRDINVNLTVKTRPFIFEDTDLDAAIYAGPAGWPGTDACLLMHETLVAVCSPQLLGGPDRKLECESDWQQYPLLQMSTRPYLWRDWFQSAGLVVGGGMIGTRFELFSMAAEAAIYGMGIALIPRLLIEQEIQSGTLVLAADHGYQSDRSYHLIYPTRSEEYEPLIRLREWIVREALDYRTKTAKS